MADNIKQGKILKGQNGFYTVEARDGIYVCRSASKIRKNDGVKLLSGDNVMFSDNLDGTGFINDVIDRKNSFIRPAVANVDMFLIVASADEPSPVPFNIDKLTVLAVKAGAQVHIVITKSDIANPDPLIEIYKKTPFYLTVTSLQKPESVSEVKANLKNKLTVLTGASGVGKSSLINLMFPELSVGVGELSEKIKRGRNTTRVTELFPLGEGTYIADTPGFGLLDFESCCKIELKELPDCFPEFEPFIGECKFKKCTHTKEQGCAIIEAVEKGIISRSRQDSYVSLYNELKLIPAY